VVLPVILVYQEQVVPQVIAVVLVIVELPVTVVRLVIVAGQESLVQPVEGPVHPVSVVGQVPVEIQAEVVGLVRLVLLVFKVRPESLEVQVVLALPVYQVRRVLQE
jgi:phosphatidylglycerophosphate synthase